MEKIENRPTKENIQNIINEIFETFKSEKYQICYKDGITKNTNEVHPKDLKISKRKWNILGIKMQKRIKRYINSFSKKQSVYTANMLLWLLSRFVLDMDYVVKVVEPKHEAIQTKRKAWKKLQAEADKALKEYKDEKGNYYKVI